MDEEVLREASGADRRQVLTRFSGEPVALGSVGEGSPAESRMPTGIGEFDRLLGGGVLRGQVALLAGPPGIGKSTLMLQAAAGLASGLKVLYVSGEESLRQVASRARRLGLAAAPSGDGGPRAADGIILLSETDLSKILEAAGKLKPGLLVLDSIQTVAHPEWPGAAGSVTQVRECAAELLRVAKAGETAVFLLGHVTKEGSLAGPRILEHIVDTVLYFDTERQGLWRVLRAQKNRFGPTDEIGLFEMGDGGLREVREPAAEWLGSTGAAAGRAFAVAVEGSRPLLTRLEALVVSTRYPLPRRVATGLDLNRVLLLLAAMEKHLRLRLEDRDVFSSVSGHLRLSDPALDLAACMAIASSAREQALPADTVFLGEVGLLGELGRVPHLELRLREAARLGFKRAVVSAGSRRGASKPAGLEVREAATLQEAAGALASAGSRTRSAVSPQTLEG